MDTFNSVLLNQRLKQIKAIREKYELSAKKISELLDFGTNSWRKYEDGEVLSRTNANLIQMISKPESFEEYILKYSGLEEKECEKVLKPVQKLITDLCYCADPLYRFNNQPDITTGFKAFDRIKTEQVISYFAERLQPFKTKLNKLLFYTDFAHFRNIGRSITGLRYNAIHFGPVPNYILFGSLADIDIIDIEYAMTPNGEVERIIPNPHYHFGASFFLPSELESMEYVAKIFKDTTASEIADISHKRTSMVRKYQWQKIYSVSLCF